MMGGMGGGMGGMIGGMRGSSLALGAEFEIMKFAVTRKTAAAPSVPPRKLSTIARINTHGASVRTITLTMQRMRWLINGESFRMDRYPIVSHSNIIELWDIQNAAMSMPHPMHIHGFSFQVISRRLITDLGWKDTIDPGLARGDRTHRN